MDVQYLVENNSSERWQANLFGQIKRGDAPVPSASDNMMGMQLKYGHNDSMIAKRVVNVQGPRGTVFTMFETSSK